MRISLDHLCKSFDGVEVLRDITFDEEVSALAIIGPSGGGKSTLLRIIGGLEAPTSGTMAVDGSPVSFDEASLRAYRATLGFVFQDGGLFHHMTALENVMMGGQGQDSSILKFILDRRAAVRFEKELRDRAYQALDFVGLAAERDRLTKDLPYGQQKKIEIARALIAHPKLILLDEPATGLNPTERAELVGIIERICSEGVSVLLIEHNMDVIMKISSWITVLNFGKKIAEGTASDIQNNDLVIEAYLGSRYKKNRGVREC